MLAARIAAGVRIGSLVELTTDSDLLRAGDRGTVTDILEHGGVVVAWERGGEVEIDPGHTPLRTLS